MRGMGKGVSQTLASLPLFSSDMAGDAASLQGHLTPHRRTASMEQSPWSERSLVGPSTFKDGEQQGSHLPTITNALLATATLTVNTVGLFKPLTATVRQ